MMLNVLYKLYWAASYLAVSIKHLLVLGTSYAFDICSLVTTGCVIKSASFAIIFLLKTYCWGLSVLVKSW